MSGGGEDVLDSKVAEELFGSSNTKFLALISDEVNWCTEAVDPVVKDGSGHSCGFFVG